MKKVMLDQMILTTCCPTNAGSKMLENFTSLFNATVVEKLKAADYEIAGKLPVGEFAIDLVGESCFAGADKASAAAKSLENDTVMAHIAFDVNGAPRRVAAQNGLVFVKPTYGTVSRFGTIPVACSGECVGVMAKNAADCREVLVSIVGKDERDGTMHADEVCKNAVCDARPVKRVAVLKMPTDANDKIEAAKAKMVANGIEICEIDAGVIASANAAWNMLMCAELCNNVSRYDGVKYGYRTGNYKTLDELYTNSRTEAFGLTLKTAILYGSDVLSTKNYMAKYDKAMRVRRVIVEAFAKLFTEFDAVLLPAVSKMAYTESDCAFAENLYTAPASITGLPAVVVGGVQLMGPAFSDGALLALANTLEKEGK
jgi:aspartyl-tRNA(Asn)/glutamyl-tRNA(Gln) amidotransferase subunit A